MVDWQLFQEVGSQAQDWTGCLCLGDTVASRKSHFPGRKQAERIVLILGAVKFENGTKWWRNQHHLFFKSLFLPQRESGQGGVPEQALGPVTLGSRDHHNNARKLSVKFNAS